jgi:hypothetical protein
VNGLYYEITGYTDEGPVIRLRPWVEAKQRLQTIHAITEDQTADSMRLQQGEEELRQVLHQLTCTLYEAVFHTPKNPAQLNADKVRKMLTECGVELSFVNSVMTIYETLDEAHHASRTYAPNRQKLKQYYGRAVALAEVVDAKVRESKSIAVMPTGKTA